jgi:hypothetical protein
MALKLNGSTDGSVSIDAPADTSPSGTDVTLTLPTSAGSSGQYLQTNGSGTLSWQTVASLSNAEDGTGTDFEFNSGFGSNGVAYGCRAWVNFNGTSTVAIREDGNVTSVTDNGIGDYTVNFTTAMPDANYSYALSGSQVFSDCSNMNPHTLATGSFRFQTFNVDASPGIRDYDQVSVAIFR